jgi:N-hydroxyarylamine O-acetyltransferase
MTGSLDLDAYYRRIQWTGGNSPTVETLAGLLAAHTAHIPFENLDVLLRRPLRLDLGSLQDKLVHARRGGYCFEHATLFAAVLEALGFRPVRHAARVVLFAPHTEVPRSHMFLTVPVDGATLVVDPGFGAFTAGFPVPLVDAETAQREPATHWMGRDGDLWALHVPRDGETATGWVSTLEPEHPIDFEVANHFTATHPSSPFANRIMLSAALPDGRVNVIDRDVTVLRGTKLHQMRLADRAGLRALLVKHFGFDLPEIERVVVPSIPEWQ